MSKEKAVVILHEDDRTRIAAILSFLMTEYETPGAIGYATAELGKICLTEEELMCMTCHLFQQKVNEMKEVMEGEDE